MAQCIFINNNFEEIDPFGYEIESFVKKPQLALQVKEFLKSSYVRSYPLKVLILFEKFVSLVDSQENPSKKILKELFLQSRFSFMGTDGMRGKIATEKSQNPILDFTQNLILSPELLYLSSKAFIKMLSDNGTITKRSNVCTGNDGRDIATNWALTNAMNHGLENFGHKVFDLGIVPTPAVPYQMLIDGIDAGAMLTASHNPADQNGIKFFIKSKKLLPEGKNGDYELSAYMFLERSSINTSIEIRQASHATKKEIDFTRFLDERLPLNIGEALNAIDLYLDNANGAWAEIAQYYFAKQKIAFASPNEKPIGTNINKQCGVAEIEGHSLYTKKDYTSAPAIVQYLFDDKKNSQKAENSEKPRFAIVLDGDGDRGFLLYYKKAEDTVYVLGGEHLALILAPYLKKQRKKFWKNTCVYTIEADVLIANTFKNTHGLASHIVDVGDKWICNYPKANMLLGFESSGHIIVPTEIKNDEEKKEYRAGNGLYSCLLALYALWERNFDESFLTDYEAAFSKTLYTYFIDKTLFYRNSSAWNQVQKSLEENLHSWIKTQETGFSFHEEQVSDTNVLYYVIKKGKNLVGTLFIRNSGTENKNGVYLKCDQTLSTNLFAIAEKLAKSLSKSIVNKECEEYKIQDEIFGILEKDAVFDDTSSYESLDAISETQLHTVLQALVKQNLIKREGNQYKRSKSNDKIRFV